MVLSEPASSPREQLCNHPKPGFTGCRAATSRVQKMVLSRPACSPLAAASNQPKPAAKDIAGYVAFWRGVTVSDE